MRRISATIHWPKKSIRKFKSRLISGIVIEPDNKRVGSSMPTGVFLKVRLSGPFCNSGGKEVRGIHLQERRCAGLRITLLLSAVYSSPRRGAPGSRARRNRSVRPA